MTAPKPLTLGQKLLTVAWFFCAMLCMLWGVDLSMQGAVSGWALLAAGFMLTVIGTGLLVHAAAGEQRKQREALLWLLREYGVRPERAPELLDRLRAEMRGYTRG